MRVSSRIHEDPVKETRCLLNPIDQLTFVVGMPNLQVDPQLNCFKGQHGGQLIKRGRPVHVWFTRAKKIEIGTIQDENSHADTPAFNSLAGRAKNHH